MCACHAQTFSGEFTLHDRFVANNRYTGHVYKSVASNGRTELQAVVTHVDPATSRRTVYTLLDRRAYVEMFDDSVSTTVAQHVRCYPVEQVPPFGDVDELFERAVATPDSVLDANNPSLRTCLESSATNWVLQWGNQQFVYCQPSSDVHEVHTCSGRCKSQTPLGLTRHRVSRVRYCTVGKRQLQPRVCPRCDAYARQLWRAHKHHQRAPC